MGKKGSIIDWLFIFIIMFVLAIVFAAVQFTQETTIKEINASGELGSEAEQILGERNSGLLSTFETIFVILVFGLGLATILLAFQINTHPAFFLVFLLILFFVALVGPEFTNTYEEFQQDSDIYEATSGMGMINFVMGAYPKIMIVIAILIGVVMYAKGGGE